MKNAHLRFGWLMYVKSTEKTTTSIRVHLDRFIGEMLPEPPRQAKAHLISVLGGDTQIAARFMIRSHPELRDCCEGLFQRRQLRSWGWPSAGKTHVPAW